MIVELLVIVWMFSLTVIFILDGQYQYAFLTGVLFAAGYYFFRLDYLLGDGTKKETSDD